MGRLQSCKFEDDDIDLNNKNFQTLIGSNMLLPEGKSNGKQKKTKSDFRK